MIDALATIPFWDKLTPAEKALCERSATVRQYPAGTYLMGRGGGQCCLGMIHVLSGEMRALMVSDKGREITLFRLSPGENCVLSASCVLAQITFATQLCVSQDAELLLLPSAIFGKLTENNIYVRCFAFEVATQRFSAVMWVMDQILFHGYDQRLALFLVAERERTGRDELHMTQEEIAIATNSAREVVTRMLKQFVGDGLISHQRGVIVLTDIEGLERVAKHS